MKVDDVQAVTVSDTGDVTVIIQLDREPSDLEAEMINIGVIDGSAAKMTTDGLGLIELMSPSEDDIYKGLRGLNGALENIATEAGSQEQSRTTAEARIARRARTLLGLD